MAEPFQVEVVAADRRVWEGRAVNVIVRTTEGDIGILPGHEPLLAALVPCAAEIVTAEGGREVIALDGGFISVTPERVSLLAQYASLATEVKPDRLGRVLVPKSLKEFAQITDDVVVVGVSNRMEVWAKNRWEEFYQTSRQGFEEVAERVLLE